VIIKQLSDLKPGDLFVFSSENMTASSLACFNCDPQAAHQIKDFTMVLPDVDICQFLEIRPAAGHQHYSFVKFLSLSHNCPLQSSVAFFEKGVKSVG
jgi:hypothetical protein